MSYSFLAIHEFDGPDGDGLLTPIPTGAGTELEPDELDGNTPTIFTAKGLSVRASGAKKAETELADISLTLAITDCRITFACEKWTKGGGWIGDPVSMAVLNTASKVRAARKRSGKILVGQARYPWLIGVYGKNAAGFLHDSTLRLNVKDNGTSYLLDFKLPKQTEGTAIATEIIRRAADFRVRVDEAVAKDPQGFESLRHIAPLQWQKSDGKLAGHTFPNSWGVGRKSAEFGRQSTQPT